MLGSLTEWILIVANCLFFAFIIGKEYQNNTTKNTKVEDHEKEIKELKVFVETKIKQVEDSNHKLNNSFNNYKSSNDTKMSIMLMLIFQLCQANNINTDMAQFVLNTDTDEGLKQNHK